MSDVGINFPTWLALLFLSVEFWPLVLVLAIAAFSAAFFTQGMIRRAAVGLAILLALDLAASGVSALMRARDETSARAYDQSVNAALAAERVIDGLKLPARTTVLWSDPTHTHITQATLPRPASLLGVTADRVQRTVDGGWAVHLAGPQSVDGWTCQPDLVELTNDGHLLRCEIASGRDWNGWPIPATTLVTLNGDTLGFVFPAETPVMAREIGRTLPATGGMTMNPDGSLASVYFEAEAPLLVCGVSLWNTVNWRYADATFGQGRARPALALTGALVAPLAHGGHDIPAGSSVEVQGADCKLTPG